MRVAAAVLIMVVAFMDFFAGAYYLVGGRVENWFGHGAAMVDEDETAAVLLVHGLERSALGSLFLVLTGLAIATGVELLRRQSSGLVICTGLLQILGDAGSVYLRGTVHGTNLVAFIASVLIIIVALSHSYHQPSSGLTSTAAS